MKTTVAKLLKTTEFPLKLYDSNKNNVYSENSEGFWSKHEYNSDGSTTYYEDSLRHKGGTPKSAMCENKEIEIDGIKYKLTKV